MRFFILPTGGKAGKGGYETLLPCHSADPDPREANDI
jgi:hypothetical protein